MDGAEMARRAKEAIGGDLAEFDPVLHESRIAGRDVVLVSLESGNQTGVGRLRDVFWEHREALELWPVLLGEEVFTYGMLDATTNNNPLDVGDSDAAAVLSRFSLHADLPVTNASDAVRASGWSVHDVELVEQYNDPVVALLDVQRGWQAQAILQLEDGGRFSAHDHAIVLRHFEETYGASLAATNGAISHLILAEPVRDAALARQAAMERLAYADTTSANVEYEPDEVTAATMVDTVWGFWWD